jgi:hypothetical protein
MPSNFSRENILPPIHSAIKAFATKKAQMEIKSLVGLSFRMVLIIQFLLCKGAELLKKVNIPDNTLPAGWVLGDHGKQIE